MSRQLSAVLVCLALAGLIVACGGDDEKGASKAVLAAFELSGSGDDARMTGPRSVEAGAVQVEFRNSTREDAGVTLVRVEGDHTAAQAVEAGQAWGDEEKPLPDWVRFVGGVTSVKARGTFSAVQVLPEGKYVAVDINTNAYTPLDVTGDGGGELPATDARIEARDYSFRTSGLEAGESRVLFTNEGREPHFALLAPIRPGKTIADVREALREESGPPPIDEDKTLSTGVLDGGESQVVDLTLTEGKYALLCFVPDRAGGQPHAFLGMVSEGVVE